MIRKRVSVVVVEKNKILGFHAEDPTNKKKYFFLPGGQIEPGETFEEAALRETLEETGFRVELVPGKSVTRRYMFHWDGKDHDCETVFLLGKLLSSEGSTVTDASYHRGVDWVSKDQVRSIFSYNGDTMQAVLILAEQNI
jgi:tRNA(adenine34) deaminase